MKVLVLLAVLCLGYVWGSDQISFQEVLNESRFICDVEELIANSTQLAKITLDLFSESFSLIYDHTYPRSENACPFGFFRCLLWDANAGFSMVRDVKDKLFFFKDNISDISQGIRYYVRDCIN